MNKKILYIIALVGITVLTNGCYPGGPEYFSDLDIVTTDYYPEYWDNNNPQTYYMPSALGLILDQEYYENNDTVFAIEDNVILDMIERNMTTLNYTRIDTTDTGEWENGTGPDVVLFAQILAVKNSSNYIPAYPWWGGYPYWPGYGYGYPGWGYPIVYSYSTGTVILEMVDFKTIDTINKILDVVWIAGMDGLLRNNSSSNEQFIEELIDKAFENSPYLKSE